MGGFLLPPNGRFTIGLPTWGCYYTNLRFNNIEAKNLCISYFLYHAIHITFTTYTSCIGTVDRWTNILIQLVAVRGAALRPGKAGKAGVGEHGRDGLVLWSTRYSLEKTWDSWSFTVSLLHFFSLWFWWSTVVRLRLPDHQSLRTSAVAMVPVLRG